MTRKCPRGVQRLRRADGSWSYRAWAMIAGVRVFGAATRDLDEAAAEAATMRHARWQAKSSLTLRDAIRLVLERAKVSTRPATYGWYREQYELITTMWKPEIPLSRVKASDLQRFIRLRVERDKVKPATLQKQRAAINRLFTVAAKNGWRGDNPCQQVDWPKVRRPRRDVFRPAEIETILSKIRAGLDGLARCSSCDELVHYPHGMADSRVRYLPHRDGEPRRLRAKHGCGGRLVVDRQGYPGSQADADVVALLFYSGLRRSELARLRVEDLELESRQIFIRGKIDDVELPLKDEAVTVLRRFVERCGGSGFLIAGESEARRRGAVAAAFHRWQVRLGEPRLHPHAMRHSFVSALINSGVDIGVVQRLSRHRTVGMVMSYVSASGPASRAALEALPSLGGARGEA